MRSIAADGGDLGELTADADLDELTAEADLDELPAEADPDELAADGHLAVLGMSKILMHRNASNPCIEAIDH